MTEVGTIMLYLSSMENRTFEPIRECRVVRALRFENGKAVIEVEVSPPLIDEGYGQADITALFLTARFEGSTVDPIDSFPCSVHIALPVHPGPLADRLRAGELKSVGWGEIYDSREQAAQYTGGLT